MPSQHETEVGLGQAMFGHAELGDRRRTARLVSTFDQMCRHPGGSLPDKLSSPADLKALYRLCECEKVSHAALIASMRQHTLGQIARHQGSVLVVHDATELDYTSMKSLAEELGQIGTGGGRGYICQNILAISADTGHVLGLIDQILHCRDEVPEKETLAEHRARETRESLLWIKGTAHLPADARLIDVADQGSDTFEFLEHESNSGRRFVVRAHKARKLSLGHEPTKTKCSMKMKECAAKLPELGRFTLDIQAQRGRVARKEAEFILRGGAVLVYPPHARYGNHGREPLPLYLVRVSEGTPPGG
ncbi:MAG: IS4/Tn5 family transposase DNA-binding protein, partial [Candidatus Binatia bacterium]